MWRKKVSQKQDRILDQKHNENLIPEDELISPNRAFFYLPIFARSCNDELPNFSETMADPLLLSLNLCVFFRKIFYTAGSTLRKKIERVFIAWHSKCIYCWGRARTNVIGGNFSFFPKNWGVDPPHTFWALFKKELRKFRNLKHSWITYEIIVLKRVTYSTFQSYSCPYKLQVVRNYTLRKISQRKIRILKYFVVGIR
jgi:hypothetical protein